MNHLEQSAWRLNERGVELHNSLTQIEHGPERRRQIQTELGMIALEMLCRQIENQDYDPASAIAFLDVNYFGFHAPAKGLVLGQAEIGCAGK